MVEWARLESECTVIPYRGFESLSLRQYHSIIKILCRNRRCTPEPTPHQNTLYTMSPTGPNRDHCSHIPPKSSLIRKNLSPTYHLVSASSLCCY